MVKDGRRKKVRRKNRWANAKGKVVSVRFSEAEYASIGMRAEERGLSIGNYLKWLTRSTEEVDDELMVVSEEFY